ncbi:MAG: hypothetical protein ACKVT2_15170 [Saprospiraceae bacterium]
MATKKRQRELPKREANFPEISEKEIQELPPEIAEILQTVPPDQRKKVLQVLHVSVKKNIVLFGPPADQLREYNEVMQNGAQQLMDSVKEMRDFRIWDGKEERKQYTRGQWFGFLLGIFGLSAATFLGIYDHDTLAGVIGGGSLVTIVTSFLQSGKKKE